MEDQEVTGNILGGQQGEGLGFIGEKLGEVVKQIPCETVNKGIDAIGEALPEGGTITGKLVDAAGGKKEIAGMMKTGFKAFSGGQQGEGKSQSGKPSSEKEGGEGPVENAKSIANKFGLKF